MAPRTSEGVGATEILKPSALPQSSKIDPAAPPNKDTPSGSTTNPTQGTGSSNLSPAEQTKLQNEHADHIYDTILSHYDWSSLPATPAEQPFKPFFLFCPKDLYSKQPELDKLVAGMKRFSASRLVAGEQNESGYAWEFRDASSAEQLAAGVDMQDPNMVLGWDLVTIEGKLKACRVPFMV